MDEAPDNLDGFAAAAIELSERLNVAGRDPASLPAWKDVRSVRLWLNQARVICAKPPPHLVKAAEWLLDNDRQIERTVRQIGEDLPPDFYRKLSRLSGHEGDGLPRVYALAHALLRSSLLQVSLAGTVRFLRIQAITASLCIGPAFGNFKPVVLSSFGAD